MLLSYRGRNCWVFREWIEINLPVNRSVSDDISFPQKRIVPAMCFEGTNASGKICALRILSFIYDFCMNSFLYHTDSNILVDIFFNNSKYIRKY